MARYALVVCASVMGPRIALADPPRVVLLAPISGTHAKLGEAAADGLSWAQSALPVAVVVEVVDTAGDAEVAAARVRELADVSDIVAVLGPIGTLESRAAAEAAAAASLPIVTLSSTEGLELLSPYVFRARVSPEAQARALAVLSVRELDRRHAAVFYPDDDYGRGCVRAFVDAFVAAGGLVTAIEAYDPEDSKPDQEAELLSGKRVRRLAGEGTKKAATTRLRKKAKAHIDFDTLFLPDRGDRVARALSFLQIAGVPVGSADVQLLGTDAWASGALAGAERLATGALVARLFDPAATDAIEARVGAFVEAFGRNPTALEAQAHDALLLVSSALQRCPDAPTRACLVQGLRSGAEVEGVSGRVRFNSDGAPARELYLFDVDQAGTLWPTY